MSKSRITEIKQALVSRIAASAAAGNGKWLVRRLSSNDLSKQSEIIVTPPAVLVFYPGEGGRYQPLDSTGSRYDVWERFLLYAVSRLRASQEQEQDDADAMLEELKDLCAGQKLVLASGVETHLWLSRGREAVSPPVFEGINDAGGQVYSMQVFVHGHWDNV